MVFAFAMATAGQAQSPKRVLILHSWGPEFNDPYAKTLREQLSRQMPGRLDLYEQWLLSGRFAAGGDDATFLNHLNTVFVDHPIDLVITLGGPAAQFVQRYRQSLLPGVPRLLADVEQRLASAPLSPNETAVTMSVDIRALAENILRVRPRTETIVVVIGNSPLEKYWVGQIRESLNPLKDRVKLTFLDDLPFSDVLKRAATLPPRSAILYVLLSPDVDGVPQDEDSAFAQLHAVANAPMFSYTDAYLGKGIVGGPLISREEQGRETARVAARLLRGELASDIRMPPGHLGKPKFDWRELRRWSIREADLPSGSTILFQEPSAWQQYRWQIASVAVALVLEAALIVALLHERRRRRFAEISAHQHMAELAHMNRRWTVAELSASIAHELTQPLTAILTNCRAAQSMLDRGAPDFTVLSDIMSDIERDDRRANQVIKRLRSLLAKGPVETHEIDLNEVMREVFEFVSPQAEAHDVGLITSLAPRPLLVSGDRVQLQQVVLNLVMNGVEAIQGGGSRERKITGRTTLVDGTSVDVAVEDSGPGIPPDKRQQIFEPFFSTKETGMGMGLSITRAIVVNHGGQIWAENGRAAGAVLRFTLPLATAKDRAQPSTDRGDPAVADQRGNGALHSAVFRRAYSKVSRDVSDRGYPATRCDPGPMAGDR